MRSFGTGVSAGPINSTEQTLLDYSLSSTGSWGMTTYFWITGSGSTDRAVISYYIDGEASPSVQFTPGMACGVGFDDDDNPWGTQFVGKGSKPGAWYHTIRAPFYKSLRVTYRTSPGDPPGGVYMQVHGVENAPLVIEGIPIPLNLGAKLQLQKQSLTLQPLEYLDVVSIPTGYQGYVLAITIAFSAPNLNTLEGCVHWYGEFNESFPGFLVATGTEDLFASSYYFDTSSNLFHLPIAGLTHRQVNSTVAELSMTRFFHMDPLFAANGGRLVWRNGDTVDSRGLKCFMESGGSVVGSPGPADTSTYAWVYVW
jgi:hypothetical protein